MPPSLSSWKAGESYGDFQSAGPSVPVSIGSVVTGAVPEQEIEFDTDTSRCTTPRQFPTDPSHNMYLQYHEKRSRITLRALGANATYASLFLMFEIMCFTSRNLSVCFPGLRMGELLSVQQPLWDLEKWRKEAMLYCSFTSVVFHLICIFTSVMTNWILSSLESLPPAGERVALKRFHTSFLGRKITNISSISFMAGVPFGLFSCGLVVPLHFKMEHLHNFALAGLSLCSGLMVNEPLTL